MNIEKEVYKQLRQDIIDGASLGGESQRVRLLLYGYLRNKPYSALESKTQYDNNCEAGIVTCYTFLASNVARELCERLNCSDSEFEKIDSWMRKRWDSKEKAA